MSGQLTGHLVVSICMKFNIPQRFSMILLSNKCADNVWTFGCVILREIQFPPAFLYDFALEANVRTMSGHLVVSFCISHRPASLPKAGVGGR